MKEDVRNSTACEPKTSPVINTGFAVTTSTRTVGTLSLRKLEILHTEYLMSDIELEHLLRVVFRNYSVITAYYQC